MTVWLALRYALAHRWVVVLVAGLITILVALPVGLRQLVVQTDAQVRQRAAATPLVLGAAGSRWELVLAACYGGPPPVTPLPHRSLDRLRDLGVGAFTPVVSGPPCLDGRLFGTDVGYFDQRGLRCASGRRFFRTGEVVLGSAVAQRFGLTVGDRLQPAVAQAWNPGAAYPVDLTVVGILAPTASLEDDWLLTDPSTVWFANGLLHGHAAIDARTRLAEDEAGVAVANAALAIEREASAALHGHGPIGELPLSAVLFWPEDRREQVLLRTRLQRHLPERLVVEPATVVGTALATVADIERSVRLGLALAAAAAGVALVLVLILSLRLRREEFALLADLGAARSAIVAQVALEVGLVLLLAGTLVAVALLALRGVTLDPAHWF